MNVEEISNELAKINHYLEKCLWMDFEFAKMNTSDIIVAGRKDISYSIFSIDINFGRPYYLSSLFSWHFDDSKQFIELVAGEEMWKIIDKYQVEKGNYIFKINAEGFETAPIIIASKSIRCEIVDEKPF